MLLLSKRLKRQWISGSRPKKLPRKGAPMKRIELLLLAATSFAVPACSNSVGPTGGDDDMNPGPGDQWDQALANRKPDYNAALKIAALRLTGDIPTMTEINTVAVAPDDAAKKAAYEQLVTQYMARPQ